MIPWTPRTILSWCFDSSNGGIRVDLLEKRKRCLIDSDCALTSELGSSVVEQFGG